MITELDLADDLEEQVWEHAVRARRLGDPDPLGPEEPPGHTTVRNANLMHPLPMTPSLMGRGVYYPEQIELFADTLRACARRRREAGRGRTPCASSAASSSTRPRCPASG